ncbi:MAG: riboflavin synthase [Bacteroidales bacterium]|nr:riboflavin synthase [Bacteroidales bacterium]
MFTGIIEETGRIVSVRPTGTAVVLVISAPALAREVRPGDSISVNGACLTVTRLMGDTFEVDVTPETVRRTRMDQLKSGSRVNLERALRFGDRLNGHLVTGHIDGLGVILDVKQEDHATNVRIKAGEEIMRLIVEKGSVAVDGISLTVAGMDDKSFRVAIIPYTGRETTLISRKPGDHVNIECDIVGKYIAKLSGGPESGGNRHQERGLDRDFLEEHGYID